MTRAQTPQTIVEKIWCRHQIASIQKTSAQDLLLIDCIFLHERTGPMALQNLANQNRKVRRPESVYAVMDHIVDVRAGRPALSRMPDGDLFITALREAAAFHHINLIDIDHAEQGITHVIAAELGLVMPGMTLVCTDSHTCTQGAFGALAWGIGTSEAEHALATQTLHLARPQVMQIDMRGDWPVGVTAKDAMLHLIATHGAAGALDYVIEFTGSAVAALDMESRMTLCNMAVEFGAVSAIIAPDDMTLAWLADTPHAPHGDMLKTASAHWMTLRSDSGASYDKQLELNVSSITPTVSWGTSPDQSAPLALGVPAAASARDKDSLAYMGLTGTERFDQLAIGGAFIGSCTNGRLSDLRRAAHVLEGQRVADGVRAICVPGSSSTKRNAEAEGLDKIFKAAGFEWGEAGCAYCFYAGGDTFAPGTRVISSTNRNFEGRQGPGVRTHLASPEVVAASAVAGHICAPDALKQELKNE